MPISSANITLRQLATLVAVVDRGGFGAAAESLNMTQSAVSQAILSLERTLEAPLLARSRATTARHRPVPTALGDAVVRHARAALREVDGLTTAAIAHQAVDIGSLRVASIQSVAAQLLPSALREFSQRYPRIATSLWEGTDREVEKWMHDGVIDIGFVGPIFSKPRGAEVVAVANDPWHVIVPAGHALAEGDRVDIRRLAEVPYVMTDGGCEPAILKLFARHKTAPNVRYRAQGTDTLIAMVAAGLGAALIPELSLAALPLSGVRVLALTPRAARTIAAVLPAGRSAPAAARLLLDVLQRQVDQRPRTGSRMKRIG